MTILYFLGNATKSQMFGCVLKTEHQTVVIDGGTPGDGEQLAALLREKANGHVDRWYFTHPHHDHIGAFLHICETASDIRIDGISCAFPSLCELKKHGTRAAWEGSLWETFESLKNGRFRDTFHENPPGDRTEYGDTSVTVLRVYNPLIKENFINNSSSVYRIDTPRKRVLILGDLGIEGGEEMMKTVPAEELDADYTQMAHHGQNGASESFYRYIRPRACLWPAPDWLWDNNNGDGFDRGPWNTVRTREWMEALGVKTHIIEKDGTQEILLS